MTFEEKIVKLPNWKWERDMHTKCGRTFVSFAGSHTDELNEKCVLASFNRETKNCDYYWVHTESILPDLSDRFVIRSIKQTCGEKGFDIWIFRCASKYEVRFCFDKNRNNSKTLGEFDSQEEAAYEMMKFVNATPKDL